MEDEKIIELFFARSEAAITQLDIKYGRACRNLSYNILNNRQDAEECVNDAYLGTWNAIPPKHPNPLLTFLCKIVRNISIKRYEANIALKRRSNYDLTLEELEGCLASPVTVEAEVEIRELAYIIDSFLESLSQENRVIFMRRYWFSDTYKQIADRVGITEKNVSVRLNRIRNQMKEYLSERGILE